MTEEALVPAAGGEAAEPPLPRLPGHLSFWLGWHAFFPQAEIWKSAQARP